MAGPPELVRAVAAHGLAGSRLSFPSRPLPDGAWRTALQLACSQRVTGLLASAVSQGALPTTPGQADEAVAAHVEAMALAVTLERELLRLVERLADAGIACRVLKGVALARLDYPDPALRAFGDVDVLVRPADFDRATALLVAEGDERRFPQPRPGFDRRFTKAASFLTPDGLEVDLHRTFVLGPFGHTVDLDHVWSSSEEFVVAGRALHALPPEVRFLNACLHAAVGDTPPRLVPLRDVAQLALSERVDGAAARRLAAAWRASAAVARAVSLAWDTLELADAIPISVWAREFEPQPAQRRTLAVYTTPTTGYAARSLASVRAIRGIRNRLAYVRALAFPDRGYLAGRHRGRLRRWRYALNDLRGARGGR